MTRWRAGAMGRQGGLLLTVLALAASPAWADRTNHLFLDETQMLPEGDVELEQWVWADGQIPSMRGRPVSGWTWFGPAVGINSHLELALPLVVLGFTEPGTPSMPAYGGQPAQAAMPPQPVLVLDSISLVARYRFFPREQDDGFQPLIRVEYQQPLSLYSGPPELKVLLVGTYGNLTGVRGTVNLGVQLGLPFLQSSSTASFSALGTAGLGVSVPVGTEFRLAAEFEGQLPLTGIVQPNIAQLFLGPSVAWTRGQIWVTFGSLFGLTRNSNRFLPKVLWGITF
jgi:hypothetical protein